MWVHNDASRSRLFSGLIKFVDLLPVDDVKESVNVCRTAVLVFEIKGASAVSPDRCPQTGGDPEALR